MALTQSQKISNSFAARYPNAGYKTYTDTPTQTSNTRQNQNQNNVDETQRNPISSITTPPSNALTSAINNPSSSSFTTPQQKTSLSNPTPSATTGMSINPITGGIITRPSSGGGDRTLINTPLPQTSISNPTPSATTGQTLNPITGSINQPPRQTSSSLMPLQDKGFIKPYSQSYLESTKQSLGIINKDIGIAFGGRYGEYENPLTPFALSGKAVTPMNLVSYEGLKSLKGFYSNPSKSISDTSSLLFSKKSEYEVKKEARESFISGSKYQYKELLSYPTELGVQNLVDRKAFQFSQGIQSGDIKIDPLGLTKESKTSISTPTASADKYQEEQYQKLFSASTSPDIKEYYKQQGQISSKTLGITTTGKLIKEYTPIVAETALVIALPESAGFIGLKDIAIGASKGDNIKILSGAAFSLVGPTERIINIPKELSIEAGTRELGMKGFTFGEVQFEQGDKSFSFIKGIREASGLRQEIKIVGPILRNDEVFIQPASKFESSIGGVVENVFADRQGFKFIGGTKGYIGGKGISLELEGTDKLVSFGKGTLVKEFESSAFGKLDISNKKLNEQFAKNVKIYPYGESFESSYFTGITKQLDETTFATRSGKIKSIELNPSEEFIIKGGGILSSLPSEESIKLYHGTTSRSAENIFKEGLKPASISGEYRGIAKAPELVSLTTEKEFAQSFANRAVLKDLTKGIKSEPIILEINYPKSKALESLKSQGGLGLYGEVKVPSVSKDFINIPRETSISFSGIKTQREGLLVKSNLKDFTFTKIISNPKFETTFDVQTTKGLDIGLVQQSKFKSTPSFVTKETISQFKTELVPKTSFKSGMGQLTKGLSMEGFKGVNLGLGSIIIPKTETKQISRSFLGLGNLNIQDTGSKSIFKTSNNLISSQDNLLKQSERFAESFKQSFETPQITKQTNFNFTPTSVFIPNMGIGGFDLGFPGIPSIGSGLGYAPRKPKKSKRSKTKVKPSFTASVFDIKTGLPKSGKFGISPFEIRGLPKGSKSFNIGI